MKRLKPDVRGVEVDAETRCLHYHSALDIIAIKMACCGVTMPARIAMKSLQTMPFRCGRDARAILCGACGYELTIREYMDSGYLCPHCRAACNPGCRNHYQFYFADATSTTGF